MATSQIVSVDVATGARQVLTSGPGRKYSPKWTWAADADTRGGELRVPELIAGREAPRCAMQRWRRPSARGGCPRAPERRRRGGADERRDVRYLQQQHAEGRRAIHARGRDVPADRGEGTLHARASARLAGEAKKDRLSHPDRVRRRGQAGGPHQSIQRRPAHSGVAGHGPGGDGEHVPGAGALLLHRQRSAAARRPACAGLLARRRAESLRRYRRVVSPVRAHAAAGDRATPAQPSRRS